MTTNAPDCTTFSDRDLLAMVHRLASDERRATAHLIASLAELDARRLYLGQGCLLQRVVWQLRLSPQVFEIFT